MRKKTRAISRHSHVHDLLEALREPGCALCTLAARTRFRYLDHLAYESVNDLGLRAKLRHSLGFCNRHAWYLVETVREVFGAAIIYRDLLHSVLHRAARVTPTTGPGAFDPSGPCIACVAERRSTGHGIATLVEMIDQTDVRAALAASEGLCAPHLGQALATARPNARRALANAILASWDAGVDDPWRLRWHAAGLAGSFGTDDVALAAALDAPPVARGDLAPGAVDPFTCLACATVRADLGRFAAWGELDDHEGGVCNVHAWLDDGSEAGPLYRRQLETAREQARILVESPEESLFAQAMRGLGLARPRPDVRWPALRCVVCARQARIEASLAASGGSPLCLPHLRQAIGAHGTDAISLVRPTWRQLDQLLGEHIRKEDYRFRAEPRGIEQSSPRWAVALIVGAPGIR
jgi:hypothetical protein